MHLPGSDIGAARFMFSSTRNAATKPFMRRQAHHGPPELPKSLKLLAIIHFFSWRVSVQTVELAVEQAYQQPVAKAPLHSSGE